MRKLLLELEMRCTAGINLSINTPLCSLNKDYLETLKFLHNLGVRYVTCSGLIITGNARTDESVRTQLSGEQLYQVLKEAAGYCYANNMEINFTSPGWIGAGKAAGAWTGCTVLWCMFK